MSRLPATTVRETWVTRGVIVVCVFVWLAQLASPAVTEDYALQASLVPSEPYRLFTAMWLHSTFPLHIMLNMFSLWVLGSQMETIIGWRKFSLLYLIAGIVGNVFFWFSHLPNPAVGASGAIYGVLGFAVVWTRFNMSAVIITVLNFALSSLIPNIAWQAHLGGFVVGALLAFLWYTLPELRKRKQLSH